MRLVAVVLFLLAVLGFMFLRVSAGGMAFVAQHPAPSITEFDLDRNAFRHESTRVEDSKRGTVNHAITILGPTDRILEPWLLVDADYDGLVLTPLDGGEAVPVPTGMHTAIWDAESNEWSFNVEAFIDLSQLRSGGVRAVGDVRPVADRLIEHQPEHADLVRRAFPTPSDGEAPR